MPASASSKASSMPKRSWWSGLTVQRMTEKVGRVFSSAEPPATAAAMRISGRASAASLMLTTMLCLREARMQASNSCRTRDSSGVSWAETSAEVAERLVRPSTTRAASKTSCLTLGRTVPSASRTKVAQPSEARYTCSPSSGRSKSGRAPAEREAGGQGLERLARRRRRECGPPSSRGPRRRRGPRARRERAASGTSRRRRPARRARLRGCAPRLRPRVSSAGAGGRRSGPLRERS